MSEPHRLVSVSVPSRSVLLLTVGNQAADFDLELDPPRFKDRLFLGGVEVRVAQMPQIRGNHAIYTLDVLHGRFLAPDGEEVSRLKVHHRRGRGDVWFSHNKEKALPKGHYPDSPSQLSRVEAFNRRYPNWRRQIG